MSFENLQELPYLRQCINECLRLYPPVIAANKICSNTCELMSSKEKPIKIEKETPILLPFYALHHYPEYYPNPEAFIPERFSPENGGSKKYKEMGVFLPFSDGPRICLGKNFLFDKFCFLGHNLIVSLSTFGIGIVVGNWSVYTYVQN